MNTITISTCLVALSLCGATGLPAQRPDEQAATRLQALRECGLAAPLTLLPVRVLGQPNPNVAEALGLVLEHQGACDLEVAQAPFQAPPDAAWEQLPGLLASHVQALGESAGKRYHLYAEFLGTPARGPEEVRFVLVDGRGGLVLCDRQTPADADFQRTAARDPDPLGCSTLVGERLFRLAGWKQAPGSIKDGRFAQRWRDKSGVPDKKELAAMNSRRKALRTTLAAAHVAVLPTVTGGATDADSCKRLAGLLGEALGCRVTAAADGSKLRIGMDSNEQKRLWDLARALRTAQGATALDADYVLVADLGIEAGSGRGWVHLALCNRHGELVLVDFMNDQHPAFQKAAPKDLVDAEKLASEHLRTLLR